MNLCMLVDCVCVFLCALYCICVPKRMCMGWLKTRVRSHFAVLSYGPETSESRPGDEDVGGLSIYFVNLFLFLF